MDARRYMIIDLEPRTSSDRFITSNVESMEHDGHRWTVRFHGSPRSYTYRLARLHYLTKPTRMNIVNHCIYIKGVHINNIQELYRFDYNTRSYYHAVYAQGKEQDFDAKDVYVSRTDLSNAKGDLWDYFKTLANETGIIIEGINVLARQYEMVDEHRDNIPIAYYLGLGKPEYGRMLPENVIYPFGCNASQKQAVENALTNQVSIIQGPPGTGKTQTILNIIANLLVARKTVLVVSNNNSAVSNIAEKLSSDKVGLGFLVAMLGSRENKASFIEGQNRFPDMSAWTNGLQTPLAPNFKELLSGAQAAFDSYTKLAHLRKLLTELETEQRYDNHFFGLDSDLDWLCEKPHTKLLQLLTCISNLPDGSSPSIWFKLRWLLRLGVKTWGLLGKGKGQVTRALESAYYSAYKSYLEREIASTESELSLAGFDSITRDLSDYSLKYLQYCVASQYQGRMRRIFTEKDIKPRTGDFLQEYPIVLSTTYSAKNCISKDYVFDYVIMDEASQVDISTGLLCLSCADNAVIVGDDKQLPNVVDQLLLQKLTAVENTFNVEDKFRSSKFSFLDSCNEVFSDAPVVLLREHYRCNPKIIEFCNRLFYDNQLVAMTNDESGENAIHLIRTAQGNHARGTLNQREIDVIKQEVLPLLPQGQSLGIITPYRAQAESINSQLNTDRASTVHKYQGRECDSIIMSMVDNGTSEFSDDANLLNVAISRAKNKLYVVATGNELDKDSNLAQFIDYIKYNNFEITDSKLHSVFDLLYSQYTDERLTFEANSKKVSDELSEIIIYAALTEALEMIKAKNIGILAHYPLCRLISDVTGLDTEQRDFVGNPMSHVDFLLYNTITKRPIMCVEVDGWKYHKNSVVQTTRDNLKDGILERFGLKPYRLATTDTVTAQSLADVIKSKITVC